MSLNIEISRESDGRWIADIPEFPGILTYGTSQDEAVLKAALLVLEVTRGPIRVQEGLGAGTQSEANELSSGEKA